MIRRTLAAIFPTLLLALFLAGQPAQSQTTPSFAPTALPASLSVSNVSARVAFPSPGPTALIVNTGSNVAYLNFGSSTVTATTGGYLLGVGCSMAYNVSGQTYVAAITASSTTTLSITTGSGIPSLPPNNCTQAVTIPGTVTVAGTVTANQGTAGAAAWPVKIDQTTPGTTNAVSATNFPATVSVGTGAQGASSPRVTVATDTATIAGSAPGTAASPSANVLSGVDLSSDASAAGVAPVSSSALAANTVIKAGAGNLYSFEVAADSTLSGAAWWLMIYNATSAPVDGAVTPAKCYAFPSGTTGYTGAFPHPLYLNTGIVIGVSTTGCFTKTASTHAFISGDAQ